MKNQFNYVFKLILFAISFIFIGNVYSQELQDCVSGRASCKNLIRKDDGEPKIGDVYTDIIKISKKINLLLPQGIWQINNVTEYKGDPTWREPWSSLTLINLNKNSPIKLVFFNFFRSQQDWKGWWTPCDKPSQFPGINVLLKNSISIYDSCVFAFSFQNGYSSLNSLKSHPFWKNELKNMSDSLLDSYRTNIIDLEIQHRKTNGLNIRQIILIDANSINVNPNKLFTYFKIYDEKNTFTNANKSVSNEFNLLDWIREYSRSSKEAYLDGKYIDPNSIQLTFNNSSETREAQTDNVTQNALPNNPKESLLLEKIAALELQINKNNETSLNNVSELPPVRNKSDESVKSEAISQPVTKESSDVKNENKIEISVSSNNINTDSLTDTKNSSDLNPKNNNRSYARKALIFGNNNYLHVPALKNAKADAQAISKVLESIGYKIYYKTDLNTSEMKKAIRQFKNEVEGGDEVIFFYAGHGIQIGSTNYLLPIDISADSEEQIKDDGIPLQRVLDDMNDRKARLTLAMIDACRDNPFTKAGRAIGGRGLAPTAAATGQMIIFSAGTGQQALDRLGPSDKDPNGLFTRVLIKEINTKGVRIDNVIREVRKKVVEAAKSVGHDQVPAIYDQVIGDFYFNP